MSESRLADYLDHVRQAALDACSFIDGLDKEDYLADKRTQNAVVMSLVVIGEAATKVMDTYPEFADPGRSLAQHAWNAQSNCAWLLRNQPRCGVGYRESSLAGIAGKPASCA